MPGRPLIVLKLGGSVLRDEGSLRRAVHEIHRWRRDDHRVVAVVSALAGTTEALLADCRRVEGDASEHSVAALIAGGELHAASLLGLLLDRAGIPARVLSPAALALEAAGPPLDAEPRSLDARPIERALEEDEVAVVPGFAARDGEGRTVVLGRGGSDLTALFLAKHLAADRCRLVKDVDGLYERDPAEFGPRPARYAEATWDDVLATDGSIVQHKAVRFARAHGLAFELGAANGTAPTLVGAPRTARAPRREPPRPLRVALLGLGTVGAGLYELARGMPDVLEVGSVLVRDPRRARSCELAGAAVTDRADRALDGADIVVEAIGGTEPARELLQRALENGSHVVTANKAVVASFGEELRREARRRGVRFLSSAAVGGSTPLLERLAARGGAERVRGVLNGTVNFVLDGLARGADLDGLLEEARARGFAERDASRDLDGRDAADKLAVVAGALGHRLAPSAIEREALDPSAALRARRAAAEGRALRQVSTLRVDGGRALGRVALEELAPGDPLAGTAGVRNAAVVERSDGTSEVARGRGAGRWPTAESLMGDLLAIARGRADALATPEEREAARAATEEREEARAATEECEDPRAATVERAHARAATVERAHARTATLERADARTTPYGRRCEEAVAHAE